MDDVAADEFTREKREEVRIIAKRLPELIALAESIGATEAKRWLEEADCVARKILEEAGGSYDH